MGVHTIEGVGCSGKLVWGIGDWVQTVRVERLDSLYSSAFRVVLGPSFHTAYTVRGVGFHGEGLVLLGVVFVFFNLESFPSFRIAFCLSGE